MPGNTRMLKEQLEKANKELQIQQEKLDKAKKDAQKWYVELGFAETRYEEVSMQLKEALSELQRFKEAKVDRPRKAPCTSVSEPQELVEEKFIIQKLEQQVLSLKAQLRDHGMLHHRYKALKNEMELLQMQIKEKKCLSPPSSPASDLDGVRRAGANEDAGPVAAAAAAAAVAASVSPEAEGSCSAHGPSSVKGTAPLLKLTSPEKIIDFHQELSKNHHSDYQRAHQATTSCLFSGCQRLRDVASVVSRRRHGIGLSDPAHFSLTKRQERLSQHSDVSQNQMGNLHAGAFDQGMKLKNVLMNNTWLSREKPGGSASIAAAAKSHLSDTMSSSNKCLSPLGEKTAASKRGNPMEMTQGKNVRGEKAARCRLHHSLFTQRRSCKTMTTHASPVLQE